MQFPRNRHAGIHSGQPPCYRDAWNQILVVRPTNDNMTTLDVALRQFEATQANLEKLDELWEQIYRLQPSGPAFGSPPEYDELCLAFRRILPSMPAIDGFRIQDRLHDYDEAGQMHLDALEIGEIEAQVGFPRFRGRLTVWDLTLQSDSLFRS